MSPVTVLIAIKITDVGVETFSLILEERKLFVIFGIHTLRIEQIATHFFVLLN